MTALLLAMILCLVALTGCSRNGEPAGSGSENTTSGQADGTVQADEAAATGTVNEGTLTGKTANEIVDMMRAGFNVGNSLDAVGDNYTSIYSQEQAWGNPVISEKFIDALADRGFTVVRLPITWYKYISDDGNYTIDPAFFGRVQTIVDQCIGRGLFVIINVHHEDWINIPTLDKDYEQIGVELAAVWKQIAAYFADYDQHLIFEGMNEPRMKDTALEWNPNTDGCKAVNYLNRIFVETVRTDPAGNNGERCIMIPTYAASSSANAMRNMEIPEFEDIDVGNLIVSIHSYTPYEFCLSDKRTEFDPAKSGDTRDIDQVFADISRYFLSKGIPVIMGETGATDSGGNIAAREAWAYYFTSVAASYGVPCILWDNGNKTPGGGESHYYIDRWKAEWAYDGIIENFISGMNSEGWRSR